MQNKHMSTEVSQKTPSLLEKSSPLLFILVIALAFTVGVLWQKVENGSSSNSGSTSGEVESPISVDNLKKFAKDLKLNTKQFNSCLDEGQKAEIVTQDIAYGESVGVRGTPGFFINGKFLGGAFPFTSFKEIIDRELDGKGSKDYKTYSKDLQDAFTQTSFDPTPKDIEIGDSFALGDPNAKVTLVEFSDFECPFCIRHFNQTYPDLKKEYIDTGKVKLVFKNFVLNFHPNAQKAHEAYECAGEQGKYWEMHDKIFSASPSN